MPQPQNPTPCRRAFQRGQSDRQPHPLTSGAYKIRNVRDDLRRSMQTLDAIREYKSGPRMTKSPASLGRCTSEDAATWIKRQPETLAHQLGYDLLPAIAALGGDGVPAAVVADALNELKPRIGALVMRCDAERARLKANVRGEYTALRAGRSTLSELIEDAHDLAQDALLRHARPPQSHADIMVEMLLETL